MKKRYLTDRELEQRLKDLEEKNDSIKKFDNNLTEQLEKILDRKLTRHEKYEFLRELIETDFKEVIGLENEEKRQYTKYNNKLQGGYLKANKFDNNLMVKQLFTNVPIELKEKGSNVQISSNEGDFTLTNSDIKLDTLISEIVKENAQELKEKGYIEKTLLNIVNKFYWPETSKHWTAKQLREIFNMLVKNMTPLYFVYEDGSERLAPLINIEIDKKSVNATATIRINANQYVKEYNDKVKGNEVLIYRPNLKALGLNYTVKDNELLETLINDYLVKKVTKIMFSEFTDLYNQNNRTEKGRFIKELTTTLENLEKMEIYNFTVGKKIRKNKNANNSEILGIELKYR